MNSEQPLRTHQRGHKTGAGPRSRGAGRPVTAVGVTALFSPVNTPNPAAKVIVAASRRDSRAGGAA